MKDDSTRRMELITDVVNRLALMDCGSLLPLWCWQPAAKQLAEVRDNSE